MVVTLEPTQRLEGKEIDPLPLPFLWGFDNLLPYRPYIVHELFTGKNNLKDLLCPLPRDFMVT